MIEPTTPINEAERQAAVERYRILDSLPERSYDDITALMAHVCNVPISLVGLIDQDRHWLKSHHGIDFNESPRRLSFCGHAILSNEKIFIVEDARKDPRFADNPLVEEHGAIGYAGVPLIDDDGFALGTLCVFDNKPMVLTLQQRSALQNMARQVMYLLERHLRESCLEDTSRMLEARNEELKRFAGALTRDIKAPLIKMKELINLIEQDAADALKGDVHEYFIYLKKSSITLSTYVDGMLAHYLSDSLLSNPTEPFSVNELFETLDHLIVNENQATLVFSDSIEVINTHRAALQQVLLNLITNAVKFGNGTHTKVKIDFRKDEKGYHFRVADNGIGIAPERQTVIFELFETSDTVNSDGSKGTGIGLATVSKILDYLGSSISIESELGQGSAFSFTLPLGTTHKAQSVAA